MSEEITILDVLSLLAALMILTLGIGGGKFRLKDKKYSNYFFAGVFVLSFISLQIITFTYVLKFDIYYGLNAALLVSVLAAITFSPWLFRVVNSVQFIKFAQSPQSKSVVDKIIVNEIAESDTVKVPVDEVEVTDLITEEVVIEEILVPKEQEVIIVEQPVTKPEVKVAPKKKPARKHGTSNTRSKRSGTNKKTGGKK